MQLTQVDDEIHGLDRYLAVADLGGRIRTKGYGSRTIRPGLSLRCAYYSPPVRIVHDFAPSLTQVIYPSLWKNRCDEQDGPQTLSGLD